MRYELTDLRLFLAIADRESLTAGASAMHLSAPSASYRLKNFEEAVGVQLFTRSSKGMELTQAGLVVRDHARTILASVDSMQREVERFSKGGKGHIRIAANSSCQESLHRRSDAYLIAHPAINLDVEDRSSEDVVHAVLGRAADIGMLAGEVDLMGLMSINYAIDELVMVTAVEHPLARTMAVKFADVLDNDFITMDPGSSNFHYLQRMAAKTGRRFNARMNVRNFATALKLVEKNVGVAIVPRSVAAPLIRERRISCIRLTDPWASRLQRIVAIDFAQLPEYIRDFVDFLVNNKSDIHHSPS